MSTDTEDKIESIKVIVRERLEAAIDVKQAAADRGHPVFSPYIDAYRGDESVARVWLPEGAEDEETVPQALGLVAWALDADLLVFTAEAELERDEKLFPALLVMAFSPVGGVSVINPFEVGRLGPTSLRWLAPEMTLTPPDADTLDLFAQSVKSTADGETDPEFAAMYEQLSESEAERRAILDVLAMRKVKGEIPGLTVLLKSRVDDQIRVSVIKGLIHARQHKEDQQV